MGRSRYYPIREGEHSCECCGEPATHMDSQTASYVCTCCKKNNGASGILALQAIIN